MEYLTHCRWKFSVILVHKIEKFTIFYKICPKLAKNGSQKNIPQNAKDPIKSAKAYCNKTQRCATKSCTFYLRRLIFSWYKIFFPKWAIRKGLFLALNFYSIPILNDTDKKLFTYFNFFNFNFQCRQRNKLFWLA